MSTNSVNMARGQALPYPCHPIHGQRVLGCVSEIDMRTNVGTSAWQEAHPPRVQKLSALRRAHQIRQHRWIKHELQKLGKETAREATPAEMVQMVETFETRDEARGIQR